MKKHLLLAFLLALVSFTVSAQVSKTVDISAGELKTTLTDTELTTVTDLTITGTINSSDFRTMRDDMIALENIDLSGVSGLNSIPESALSSTEGRTSTLKSIIIPEGVTSINFAAFHYCPALESVTFPSTLTSIGEKAFRYSEKLETVDFSNTALTEMGYACFEESIGLQTVILPDTFEKFGDQVFSECSSLVSINIPEKVKILPEYLFNYCNSLTTVTYESNSIMYIEKEAFYDCESLTKIELSNSLRSIGSSAFSGCKSVTNPIVIPSSSVSLSIGAFSLCDSIPSFTFANGTTTIPENILFLAKSIDTLILPEGVKTINESAFNQIRSLKNVVLPSTITTIKNNAFQSCDNLNAVSIFATTPPVLSGSETEGVFYMCDIEEDTLYVPIGSKALYEVAEQWKDFGFIVEMQADLVTPEITITESDFEIYDADISNGTVVARITAEGTKLTYSISGDADFFNIDATSGVITVADAQALIDASIQAYDIVVEVSNGEETVTKNVSVRLKSGSAPTPVYSHSDNVEVSISGNSITVSNINGTYAIVSINGVSFSTGKSSKGTITVTNIPSGIYILQTDTEAIPFIIQ